LRHRPLCKLHQPDFSIETRLSDPLKILAGTGRRARHVKIQSLNDTEKPGIAEQVREADLLTRGR
jgi:hypothetical protein